MSVVAMRLPELDQDSFEAFWRQYPHPRRVGKPLARAKWEAITNGGLRTRTLDRDSGQYVEITLQATPAEILSGLKRYDDRVRKKGVGEYGYEENGRFICHPATWLNQGRWED